ncbi:MAG TPA: dihydrofolate reductase family protein [Actinophytocola sp.]|jgi:dihydrofolate reductase|uniref:dihydrofolate reductase family protein n=1 Tax=Actinophytocola sp. TaxID=1872138 RepID=UPI002F925E5D
MRRIINSTYVSLDGVVQNPQNWPSLGSFSAEGDAIQNELLQSCDAVVMGRHTYDGFAPVWSARSGDAFSDRINAMPKYVASRTLRDPQWANTTVFAEDAVKRIAALKEQPGGDIVQYGFGELSYALMAEGLVDELRLWVHPFFVGEATTDDLLFRPGRPALFDLADSSVLESGVIVVRYTARR